MLKPYYIYVLKDPVTNSVRYVGKTNNVKYRLYEHTRRGGSTKKDEWIFNLWIKGMEPIMEIIEECMEDNWHEREKFHIAEYKKKKAKLLNSNSGITRRLPGEFRKAHSTILAYAAVFRLPIKRGNLLLQMAQDEYIKVYGSKDLIAGYYYVNIDNKRIYVPKSNPIYTEDLTKVPIIDKGWIYMGRIYTGHKIKNGYSLEEYIDFENRKG